MVLYCHKRLKKDLVKNPLSNCGTHNDEVKIDADL